MPSVFVNYRTEDALQSAVLIERELSRRFGSAEIFRAGKSVPEGTDFARYILRAVQKSDLLLALIGPRWLEAPAPGGGRALDDPDDWVRREIIEAFDRGLTVIPVLLDRTSRLSKEQLPDSLVELAGLQNLTLSHRDPDADLARLARAVRRVVPHLNDSEAAGEKRRGTAGGAGTGGIHFYASPRIKGDVVGGDKYSGGAAGEENE
ncbi:toll/interleukin-1 receptor domain-containing protein [Streptomyces sp. NPDC002018]|uniref:toll/interleukin-1 receptor domain-containing protein n=1 Tax=Streptomyces sp. NPDC002018 TaxID=3364629 RepID=UPI0036B96EEF